MRYVVLAGLLFAFVAASSLPAPELIDLIPENAEQAIAFRGPDVLKRNVLRLYPPNTPKNEQRLVTQADQWMLPGLLFAMGSLKGEGIDLQSPMLLVSANSQDVLGKILPRDRPWDNDTSNPLQVRVFTVASVEAFAKEWTNVFTAAELRKGNILKIDDPHLLSPNFLLNGKQLLRGAKSEGIESVRRAARVGRVLGSERRKFLADADVLVHLGHYRACQWLAGLRDVLVEQGQVADQLRDLFAVAETTQFATWGVHFDDRGIDVRMLALFPDDLRVAKALSRLSAGNRSSTLVGLPVGDILLAQAAAGNGRIAAPLFRGMFVSRWVKTDLGILLSAGNRPAILGAVDCLWRHLRSERLAVYEPRLSKDGRVAAIAILEPDDPTAFLAEIGELAAMGQKDNTAAAKKLIKELGDDDFDTREAASARLLVVGAAALPLLEQAGKAADREMARRAEEAIAVIQEAIKAKRRDLLAGTLAYQGTPTLTLSRAAEKRGDRVVDVLRVRLLHPDNMLVNKLTGLLGPDWDKVRLVVHGRHVVVLLGSDVDLLDTTLANLDKNDPGLAKWTGLKAYQDRAATRQDLELHVDWQRLLTFDGERFQPRPHAPSVLTSLGLCVEKDALQAEAWLPTSAIPENFVWSVVRMFR